MTFFGENRIFEEGACAQAIRVSRSEEHAFARADMAHSLARLGEIRRRFAALEVPLEVGIGDARISPGSEGVGDAENDESSALAGVEDASPVAEPAGFGAKFAQLTIFVPQVENLY